MIKSNAENIFVGLFKDFLKDIGNIGTEYTNYPRLLGTLAILSLLGYGGSKLAYGIKRRLFD